MSLWSRVRNIFRSEQLCDEADEELRSHIEEAARVRADVAAPRKKPRYTCRGVGGIVARGRTGPDGSFRVSDSNECPQFQTMRAAVKDDAEMVAASWVDRVDVMYRFEGASETEKAHRQHVSGAMFGAFGLTPALGRVLTDGDDAKP